MQMSFRFPQFRGSSGITGSASSCQAHLLDLSSNNFPLGLVISKAPSRKRSIFSGEYCLTLYSRMK